MKISPVKCLRLCILLLIAAFFGFSLQAQKGSKCKSDAGCTTIIFGKEATADGSVLMAHNEDYGPNDCFHLVHHPRESHAPGEVIRFAFETVPHVPRTFAYTALEMYSAERLGMPPAKFLDGFNEYGVSLASNCIDCREPVQPFDKGLGWPEIGQIVLQRCRTAREAVDLCGRLVDQYTFNGFEATSCKNLTFLIADADEGWFMEVTKRHWVAKRVPEDGALFYANQALIETDWDSASADLVPYATAQGWYDSKSGKKFSFREAYGIGLGNPANVMREKRARELLVDKLGRATIQDLILVMRDHYEGMAEHDTPHSQKRARPICVSGTQSTQIYHLRKTMPAEIGCVMWSLASSPCLGVYTPIWAGYQGETPVEWQRGADSSSPDSAWWTFEDIQRTVAPKENPDSEFWKATWPVIRKRWDEVEKKGADEVAALEKEAMGLWRQGKKNEANKFLTDYTNTRLHSDFLEARSILESIVAKGRKPGRE